VGTEGVSNADLISRIAEAKAKKATVQAASVAPAE